MNPSQRIDANQEMGGSEESSVPGQQRLGERLRIARESLGKSQAAMDKPLGIGRGSWQRYESGGQSPGGKVIAALVRLGFNANWLLAGVGTMRNQAGQADISTSDDITFASVPNRSNPVARVGINTDFLERLGVSRESLIVTTMEGDSMEPTVRAGALIIADGSVKTYDRAGLYLVSPPSGPPAVYRMILHPGSGQLLYILDNKAYQCIGTLGASPGQISAAIRGRVLYVGNPAP